MDKKERFNAVRKMQEPDYMPVWPRALSQMIYATGWLLPDVTGKDWYDSEKCAEAVLWNLRNFDYDVAIPCYTDRAFGIPVIGGEILIPVKYGMSVGADENNQIKDRYDWLEIRKKLANLDVRTADPRMKGALETIRKVSDSVGEEVPLVTTCYLPSTSAMFLFRPYEAFLNDMIDEPEWVDEMCRVAAEWNKDWIRAQYEAGANSVTFIADTLGILMISPQMAERYSLPYIHELTQMVGKEFNQGVWLHIHGNMKTPIAYDYLKRIIKETCIEGLHLDESHPPDWIKEKVVNAFGIPACVIYECTDIARGPVEKIEAGVKDIFEGIGDGLGMMMAPCCQVLPFTPNDYFKAWVDAAHKHGRYPLKH